MPSTNGVYTLPLGYLAVTGATIQASQHNPPLEDIAAALTLRLSRDGTAPMIGPVQMAVGTVAAPGAVFSTDPSSGFYKTTNGIGVAIGGVNVAEFLPGGVNGARFLGELIPYTCTAAPALTVLPYGQTLSRITYAALWAQAQIEIAAGSTLYNNGDGSTTFGIPDMRGRVPAGWDVMGGTAALRLTTTTLSSAVLGGTGGTQTVTLTAAQIPVITSGVTVSGSITGNAAAGSDPVNLGTQFVASTPSVGPSSPLTVTGSFSGGGSATSNNAGGQTHPNVQPVLVTNYLLFAGA